MIEEYRRLPVHHVVGLMSGTSCDGVDAVRVRIEGRSMQVLEMHSEAIPGPLREQLFRLFEDRASVREAALANVAVGELFARAALALQGDYQLVCSHGQTVAHLPDQNCTLQIGEPAVIAARTGRLTVADFRPADVALGGQGAPLVPFFDHWLLASATVDRLAVNLGGMANITWLPRQGEVLGWDTGPANVLMDALAEKALGQPFDHQGALAAQGEVLPELLEHLLQDPYYHRPGPKSTGREQFGRELVESIWSWGKPADLMRTALELTIETLQIAVRQLGVEDFEAVVGGGGGDNPVLMAELGKRWGRLRRFDEFGVSGRARECAAFALFGHLTVMEQPSALPSVTGARGSAILGKICLPPIRQPIKL